MPISTPDPETIKKFHCAGAGQNLHGGEGNAIRIGDCVFKPIDNAERYSWGCELLTQIPRRGFRISMPIRSSTGSFVHNGWGASAYEPGEHIHGNWDEKIRISRLFHDELNKLEITKMPPSEDFWSQAHEIAWQVLPLPKNLHPEMKMKIESIFIFYKPLARGSGIIHSDLCGNFLFMEDHDPCIIDFSPAYGTTEYGEAILAADAIAWEGASLEIVDLIVDDKDYRQNLLRAINFRIIVAALFSPGDAKRFFDEYTAFAHLLDFLIA